MRGPLTVAAFSTVFMLTQFSFSATKPVKGAAGAVKKSVAATEQTETAAPADSAAAATPASDASAAQPPASTEPSTAADFRKQGDLLIKKGQTEKAMEAYKQCLEMAGDDTAYTRIALTLGKYYYGKKMLAEALSFLVKVTGRGSEALPFKVMLASTHLAAGSADSAIALLEPIASNQKVALASRKEMFKIIGDAYLKLKQDDKAVVWYGKHLATGGAKTPDIAYLVAFSQEKTAPAKAKLAYEANVKSFPNDYRSFVRLGIINAKNRATLPTALGLLKKASLLADTIPSIWIEIGKVNASLGKKDDELEAYRTCLRADADNLEAKIRLGTALLDAGSTEDAIEYLEKAHKQAPDSTGPMVALSAAHIKNNNSKKAIDLLVKIKAVQPKNLEVRKQLIEAYKATNQDQKAIDEVNGALEVERDPDLLLVGGKLLAKQKRLDEAVVLLEELLGTIPDNIDALMTMARVKRDQKKSEEAVEIYKEVSIVDPKYAPALYERAEVHLEENKVKWAEMFYQRALAADPQFALAEVGLAKLALIFKNRESFEDHLSKANVMAPGDPVVQKAIDDARNPRKPAATEVKPPSSSSGDENAAPDNGGKKKRRK